MLLSSVFLQGRKEAGIDNMTRYSTEKRVVEKWLVDAIVLAFSCKFPLSNLTANFSHAYLYHNSRKQLFYDNSELVITVV